MESYEGNHEEGGLDAGFEISRRKKSWSLGGDPRFEVIG